MTGIGLRCAHCGSNAVSALGGRLFRCAHCGTEGRAMAKSRRSIADGCGAGRPSGDGHGSGSGIDQLAGFVRMVNNVG